MERKIAQKPNKFIVGEIAFCNGGCTMQLPTFYRVVRRTQKTIWLVEILSHESLPLQFPFYLPQLMQQHSQL